MTPTPADTYPSGRHTDSRGLVVRRRSPLAWLAMAVLAVSPLYLAGAACNDGAEEDPYQYAPSQAAFQQASEQYNGRAVRQAAGGAEVVGRGTRTTDVPTASTMARENAVDRMFGNYLLGQLRAREPEASAYFERQPAEALMKLAQSLVPDSSGPFYRWLELTAEYNEYDLYQRYTLPRDREQALIADLIDVWRRTAPTEPQNIEFSVVLANMPSELNYEEKLERVVRAVEQQVRAVGANGSVVALDAAPEQDPEYVATRKRQLIHSLENGTIIEVTLMFEYTRRNRLESVAFTDVRGRWQEPVAITEHPTPRGGRYDYRVHIPSLFIQKGQRSVRVRITEAGGREFVEEYELTPHRFEYSDENIGLLEIQGFDGRVQNLLAKLREVRLPDADGQRTVVLRLPSRMVLDGDASLGREQFGVGVIYQISLYRPSATTVYVLQGEVPAANALRELASINELNWNVVWRQHDPERRFGDLSDIRVPGDGSGDLYLRIDYNSDRDTDVLRFNVQGYAVGDVVREQDAEVVFSTTRSQN